MGSSGNYHGSSTDYTQDSTWDEMSPEEKEEYIKHQKAIRERADAYLEEEKKKQKIKRILIVIGILILLVIVVILICRVSSAMKK